MWPATSKTAWLDTLTRVTGHASERTLASATNEAALHGSAIHQGVLVGLSGTILTDAIITALGPSLRPK